MSILIFKKSFFKTTSRTITIKSSIIKKKVCQRIAVNLFYFSFKSTKFDEKSEFNIKRKAKSLSGNQGLRTSSSSFKKHIPHNDFTAAKNHYKIFLLSFSLIRFFFFSYITFNNRNWINSSRLFGI